jgi:hypothetical protein
MGDGRTDGHNALRYRRYRLRARRDEGNSGGAGVDYDKRSDGARDVGGTEENMSDNTLVAIALVAFAVAVHGCSSCQKQRELNEHEFRMEKLRLEQNNL